ncbi:hypothetical protein K438DRAFT_2027352 [Mycena galopus ATCC 62051]|nr:hypothetical protein K438DRAFT_2027352 [Mycena galopus ATCC 62051]
MQLSGNSLLLRVIAAATAQAQLLLLAHNSAHTHTTLSTAITIMSDTFTSFTLEEFGVNFAAVSKSQPNPFLEELPTTARTADEPVGVPQDFEVTQGPDPFYCVIS